MRLAKKEQTGRKAILRCLVCCLLTLSAVLGVQEVEMVEAQQVAAPAYSAQQRESLHTVRTLLLAGEVSTWLDLAEPPYNIAVTLKIKLERAGFRVVLDPDQPHDAVLVIQYQESPGREYQRFEQGTTITCDLALRHKAVGTVQAYRFEAATTWPTPVGSLYWDAVQNLEENPYYYYLGELMKGWLGAQEDAGAVFSRMLRHPPMTISTDGGGSQPTGQVIANQEARLNAVRELGRLKDRRALETLWGLVAQPSVREREVAVAAIGDIGDPASLDRLTKLYETETDPEMRAAAEAAMTRIRKIQ